MANSSRVICYATSYGKAVPLFDPHIAAGSADHHGMPKVDGDGRGSWMRLAMGYTVSPEAVPLLRRLPSVEPDAELPAATVASAAPPAHPAATGRRTTTDSRALVSGRPNKRLRARPDEEPIDADRQTITLKQAVGQFIRQCTVSAYDREENEHDLGVPVGVLLRAFANYLTAAQLALSGAPLDLGPDDGECRYDAERDARFVSAVLSALTERGTKARLDDGPWRSKDPQWRYPQHCGEPTAVFEGWIVGCDLLHRYNPLVPADPYASHRLYAQITCFELDHASSAIHYVPLEYITPAQLALLKQAHGFCTPEDQHECPAVDTVYEWLNAVDSSGLVRYAERPGTVSCEPRNVVPFTILGPTY
ncbi:uncharacterized protein ACA1_342020 [Acanthamoeba castellanii str. Neff]|uniref:Uncharacterized protein n=1 Tax=Acanthamoeba castellanii (strain ATCC 30010 / Neff) TaxID=1257118 RepID=L8HEF5_ACACF|nr:uncharacterized protein ACA1_342020 [Acanthamoeba castellanii str. Neff]ELR23138.1 hypothetical protein ACA1_342020 [Acanthamoeba castellanii str. Neff]